MMQDSDTSVCLPDTTDQWEQEQRAITAICAQKAEEFNRLLMSYKKLLALQIPECGKPERIKSVMRAKELRELEENINVQLDEDLIESEQVEKQLKYPVCPFTFELIQQPVCNSKCCHIFELSSLDSDMFDCRSVSLYCPECQECMLFTDLCKDVKLANKIAQWKQQGIYTKEYLLQHKRQNIEVVELD
jgi:hypothetical protein